MHLEELRRQAAAAIEAAFPVVPVVAASEVENDHCPECSATAAKLAGNPWPQLTKAHLAHDTSPHLLTAAAFRYYLPAMMLRSLEDTRELDDFRNALVGALSPSGGKPSEHDRPKLTGYTGAQVHAVLCFLRCYEASEAMDGERDKVRQRVSARAIKYWSGLLAESPP
jgi:hypothetical protein